MNVYSFYLKKDYCQFRRRIIAESAFALRIQDFDIQENDRALIVIKRENDSNDEAQIFELKRATEDKQRFIFYFTLNERDFFEFKIVIQRLNENQEYEVVEESAINIFRYSGIIWNDDEVVLSDPQFPVFEQLLGQLNDAKSYINEEINTAIRNSEVFEMTVQDELDMIHSEITDFKQDKNKEIDTYIQQQNKEIDTYVRLKDTQIDEYVQSKNTEIDTYFEQAQRGINDVIASLDNLLDRFIADEEVVEVQQNKEQLELYTDLFEQIDEEGE